MPRFRILHLLIAMLVLGLVLGTFCAPSHLVPEMVVVWGFLTAMYCVVLGILHTTRMAESLRAWMNQSKSAKRNAENDMESG